MDGAYSPATVLYQELQRFLRSNRCSKKKKYQKKGKNDYVLQNYMYLAHLFILWIVKVGHAASVPQER